MNYNMTLYLKGYQKTWQVKVERFIFLKKSRCIKFEMSFFLNLLRWRVIEYLIWKSTLHTIPSLVCTKEKSGLSQSITILAYGLAESQIEFIKLDRVELSANFETASD